METAFTPLQSLAGGAMIGVAAVALLALHGRIMGMTGILAGALAPTSREDWLWRSALLAGAVAASGLLLLVGGYSPEITVPASTPMLVVGGLLVGLGVTFGSGCTSGHGVCGLARFSGRSLAATLVFMATTAATVFVVRHMAGG